MTPLSSRHDPRAEREPPPLPTPVTFPQYEQIKLPPRPAKSKPDYSLSRQLARLKGPGDAGADLLSAFNIELFPISHSADFFPLFDHHLPPLRWLDLPDDNTTTSLSHPKLVSSADIFPDSSQERCLGTGRPYPGKEVFAARLKEICVHNEDAFGALSRTPTINGVSPKLAHFRRFWEGLDSMAYYWDTSLDDYVSPPIEQTTVLTNQTNISHAIGDSKVTAQHDHEPRKRVKTTPASSPLTDCFTSARSIADRIISKGEKSNEPNPSKPNSDGWKYRGHRIGNGANMPESYRANTVKAFIEPVAWCFGCNVSAHRRTPLLAIDRLMMPVRLSYAVWRAPMDKSRARTGYLDGPVMGVQCRESVDFCKAGPQAEVEAILDLLTEISGLLTLAEERAREGNVEIKPGLGKWWTENPRWGGAAGGEIGDDSITTDELSNNYQSKAQSGDPKDVLTAATDLKNQKTAIRRREIAIKTWKKLSPGLGYWDPRVSYQQIGKEKSSAYDEVSSSSLIFLLQFID